LFRTPGCRDGVPVLCALSADRYHCREDGGAAYLNRYSTFEFARGRESDPWKALVQTHWERLMQADHAPAEVYVRLKLSSKRRTRPQRSPGTP
jgi:hypothetical protein